MGQGKVRFLMYDSLHPSLIPSVRKVTDVNCKCWAPPAGCYYIASDRTCILLWAHLRGCDSPTKQVFVHSKSKG